MEVLEDEVQFRPVENSDLNFILSSWLKSYRSSPQVRDIPASIYFDCHQIIIKDILMHSSKTIVMCDSVNPEVILGYIVCDKDSTRIHYLYIKHMFRGLGLGLKLFKQIEVDFPTDKPITVSHYNLAVANKSIKLSYDPYL